MNASTKTVGMVTSMTPSLEINASARLLLWYQRKMGGIVKRLSLAVLLGFFSLGAFASGTQTSSPSVDSFAASKTMKCVIVAIKAPNMLMLEDMKTGTQTPFRLAEGIKLKAKRMEVFDGRKELSFSDLAVGQTVKVSVIPDRYEIRTLKVLAPGRNDT